LASAGTRIQLCGRLVAEIEGVRVEDALPGRQGRLLFGYLVAHRHRATHRDALIDVLWPEAPPASPDGTLRPLLSKLRQVLGQRLQGRGELQLVLPGDARVDVETARRAIHDAGSAVAQERWHDAWLPARIAWSVTQREFMTGARGPWVEERRGELEELHLRALECIAQAGIRLGGAELPAAEQAARALVKAAPYRESGYRHLMEALEAGANVAEALRVYDQVRCLLREELGVAPGQELAQVHRRLLTRV
jgi:DNA-binding SARP family transcriptional activator